MLLYTLKRIAYVTPVALGVSILNDSQLFDFSRAWAGIILAGQPLCSQKPVLETSYPYYPSVEHRGADFGSYLAPSMEDMPVLDTVLIAYLATLGTIFGLMKLLSASPGQNPKLATN